MRVTSAYDVWPASDPCEAQACVREALAVARRQEARALELRAASSLSRMLRSGGEMQAGRALLGEVLAGFSEGFTTRDLVEAKRLATQDGNREIARPIRQA